MPEIASGDTIRKLFVDEQDHFDVAELKRFPNLTALIIRDTPLDGLNFLSDYPQLEILELYGNALRTIEGLDFVPDLKELQINHQFITDAGLVGQMVNLKVLRLYDNSIKEVTSLAPLVQLERLDIGRNPIKTIDALEGLTQLKDLSLYKCEKLESLDVLANYMQLTDLNISHLNIPNFSLAQLGHMEKLENLRIQGMVANNEELNHIAGMFTLEQLTMGMNDNVTSIEPLRNLTALFYLDIHSCNITDISPVENFHGLVKLVMYKNQVSDVSPLLQSDELRALFLYENPITDYLPLGVMKNLQHLYLSRNGLSEENLKSLRRLLPNTEMTLM